MDTTVKTAFDMKNFSGAKFTAALPNKDEVEHTTFYSQFQLFLSAVGKLMAEKQVQLLTISSLSEGQGNSFVANEIVEHHLAKGDRVLHIESTLP